MLCKEVDVLTHSEIYSCRNSPFYDFSEISHELNHEKRLCFIKVGAASTRISAVDDQNTDDIQKDTAQ